MALSLGKKRKAAASPKATPSTLDKFNDMPPKKRTMILVAIIIIVGGAFIWFYAKPKYDQIKSLEIKLGGLEKDLTTAKKNAAEIDMIKLQVKEAEEAFKREIKALPETEEIPVLLTNISKAGQEENLEFLLFEPQNEALFDYYSEIPVKIEVIGEYHDVARFFSKLTNFPRVVVVRDLSVKPYAPGKESTIQRSGFNLSVSCIASTYKFTDKPLPDTNKKK